MHNLRKRHDATLKAKVALESILSGETVTGHIIRSLRYDIPDSHGGLRRNALVGMKNKHPPVFTFIDCELLLLAKTSPLFDKYITPEIGGNLYSIICTAGIHHNDLIREPDTHQDRRAYSPLHPLL